jgi:hypothetical protein
MFKVLDDILASLMRIERLITARSDVQPVKPLEPPKPLPGEPLYPCQPTPSDNVPIPGGGGRYDSSLIFKTKGHRHEKLFVNGEAVTYTLPQASSLAVSFTIAPTPMYGPHWFGERPSYDRWVTDASGNTLLREEKMQLGGGSMYVKGPFTGPIYLHLKPFDFTGWVFVEYQ